MQQLENYVLGSWTKGSGKGTTLYSAITGTELAIASTDGLNFKDILSYGREKGSTTLRKLTFHERANLLRSLAKYLSDKKEIFYDLSYETGATKIDSWIDIEGGIGNLYSYASKGSREFPDTTFYVDGATETLGKKGTFMASHICVPLEGVAIHINAFNFPCWGMLEKIAVNILAGMSAIVKPATVTSYLTERMVKEIIASKILPEGSLQLLCGSARELLDHVEIGDVVTFTGSASVGKKLKSAKRIIDNAIRFNMEADSLNCSILGENDSPSTPEFQLFIKEVTKEMTIKAGQKCTAIRRIIVPEKYMDDVKKSLTESLKKIKIGNPRNKDVRMGSLAGTNEREEVLKAIAELRASCELLYQGNDDFIDVNKGRGAFMPITLLYCNQPFQKKEPHEIEAFGPVSTILPYKNSDEAIELAKLGKGSLVGSVITSDESFAAKIIIHTASYHGRFLILNSDCASESTGHGSPLPQLVHGGPGRAGGGEEMGGVRGVLHYMQRTAVQGSPSMITAITKVYQQGARTKPIDTHPFRKHYEEIQIGQSLETHGRTVTETDIVNFSNVSWDHFYAHTDTTSLQGTIFKERVAHGYFVLSAAAGLFVEPRKGPVIANYGLNDCRFIQPVYTGDTIRARLTCKEKINKRQKGKEYPSGVVQWLVEILNQHDELVAIATILTLVAKKSPFIELKKNILEEYCNKINAQTKMQWGLMLPQHIFEHLEDSFAICLGKISDDMKVPPEKAEPYQTWLYTYKPIPHEFKRYNLPKESAPPLRHKNLNEAKKMFLQSFDEYQAYYKANPTTIFPFGDYGEIGKEEMDLLHRKHISHHFAQCGVYKLITK